MDVKQYPPNYNIIKMVLPVEGKKGIVYSYDKQIYNPDGIDIPKDVIVHEQIHFKQQGDDPDGWWFKYLQDVDFRLNQEIEAYSQQFIFGKKQILSKENELKQNGKTLKPNKMLNWLLDDLAHSLSGDMYCLNISFAEAKSKIRNLTKKYEAEL